MILRRALVLALAASLLAFGAGAAAADDDPLAYSDPGMHFRPPDGWERVPISYDPALSSGDHPPRAIYLFHKGKPDQRAIQITIEPFQGTLDGFLKSHAGDLRNQGDSIFIAKQEKTTLSNTMPAYWLKINQGSTVGHFLNAYEYVVIDLSRGIVVSYVGHMGDFTEKEAKEALSSLYVVVYPRGRP